MTNRNAGELMKSSSKEKSEFALRVEEMLAFGCDIDTAIEQIRAEDEMNARLNQTLEMMVWWENARLWRR